MADTQTFNIEILVRNSSRTASNVNKVANKVNQLSGQADRASLSVSRVSGSMQGLANQSTGIAKGFAGSTNAAINFNRVISDMPYGIMGVANNLEAALFSFRAVTAGTVGFTGALKALGAAMFTGPGAILTAITIIPTALIMLQQHLRKTSDGMTDLQSITSKTAEAFNKLWQESDKIQFSDETLANRIIADEIAMKRLNQTIDSFIEKQDKAEKKAITSGNLLAVPFKAIASLVNTIGDDAEKYESIVDGLTKQRSEIQSRLLVNRELEADAISKTAENERIAALMLEKRIKDAEKLKKIYEDILKTPRETLDFDFTPPDDNVLRDALESLKLEYDEMLNIFESGQIKTLEQTGQYLTLLNEQLQTVDTQSARDEITALINKLIELQGLMRGKGGKQKEGSGAMQDSVLDPSAIEVMINQLQQGIDSGALTSVDSLRDAIKSLNQAIAGLADGELKTKLEAMVKDFENLANRSDAFNQIIQRGLADTVSAMAFSVGSGENLFATLLDSIANMAAQLGQLAIGIGITIEGIRTALKSLNPAAAIGAGVALLALAGFARSRAAAIGGGGGGAFSNGNSGLNTNFNQQSFNNPSFNTYLDGTRVNQTLNFGNLSQSQKFGG